MTLNLSGLDDKTAHSTIKKNYGESGEKWKVISGHEQGELTGLHQALKLDSTELGPDRFFGT